MATWRTDWVTEKKRIALCLANGECGGSYGEAVLILCAVLSALAADIWPGKGIDQMRFVELLKNEFCEHIFATCTLKYFLKN